MFQGHSNCPLSKGVNPYQEFGGLTAPWRRGLGKGKFLSHREEAFQHACEEENIWSGDEWPISVGEAECYSER